MAGLDGLDARVSCSRSGRWPGSASLLSGDEPDEYGTHLGYLIASVCVVPLALRSVQDDHGAWSLGVVGVAALAVAVISVRMVVTL